VGENGKTVMTEMESYLPDSVTNDDQYIDLKPPEKQMLRRKV
jgi:hypothetical protein